MYQWKISKYRRDKRTGALNPVQPSKYYKHLLEGVEMYERKTDRKRIEGLQLDDKRNQKATRNIK